VGESPKNIEYLVIDAPGALSDSQAEQLISEAHAIITPLQPSFFDIDSTRRFLKHLQEIKRIRKGKVQILLLANRVKANTSGSKEIQEFFSKIEQQPVAWISERTAYGQLAMQGLSVFDKSQKNYVTLQNQWQPVLNAIIDDPSEWF
jgi:chromosome partitioning protein